MMCSFENWMTIAIGEAKKSLQEGNLGFGAVIVKADEIIAQTHDYEVTDQDATSHAEINAIKIASKRIGKNLNGCTIISTHEPCPMCATAIVWSGIKNVIFGYPISDAIKQDWNRINISCEEIFNRSGMQIEIQSEILKDECSLLYDKLVRSEVKRLRNATETELLSFNQDSIKRRLAWFSENRSSFEFINDDLLMSAYQLLLCRFGIDESDAPVIEMDEAKIKFHSQNFCPTLEACKILALDTRYICKRYNEDSTDQLVKQIDLRLRFERNYEKLRPYSNYCEEMIFLDAERKRNCSS